MKKKGKKPKKVKAGDIEVHKTSVYIPWESYKSIQRIAVETDKRVHDLILDGLDYILKKNGDRPIDRRPKGGWES